MSNLSFLEYWIIKITIFGWVFCFFGAKLLDVRSAFWNMFLSSALLVDSACARSKFMSCAKRKTGAQKALDAREYVLQVGVWVDWWIVIKRVLQFSLLSSNGYFCYTSIFFDILSYFLLYLFLVISLKASITKRGITNITRNSPV